jgi:hypothetical protein
VLLALTFQVAKEAPASGEIVMKAQKVSALTVDGRPLPVAAIDGRIALVATDAPPVVACFLYMH